MKRALLLFVIGIAWQGYAQKKSTPYVVLISFDGFRYDYVSRFKPPAFQEFIRNGSASDGLIPSFPSKTFPNHYTLVTGLYPGNHGLVDNTFYDPYLRRKYTMRDREAVRDPSFYGGIPIWLLAQQQGLRSASYFWVGSEVAIHGKLPDYYLPYHESTPNEKRVEQVLAWLQLPDEQRPHFISLYFSLVDSEGHRTGPYSEQLRNTVLKADSLLGLFMDGLKKTGLPVNVILVSDHGMSELKQDEQTFIPLHKLVDVSDTSNIYVNGGTQAHVYTKKPDSLYRELKKLEKNFKVYKRSTMHASWHYDNIRSGDLLIVADPGYYIQDQSQSADSWDSKAFGAHGYDPALVNDMRGIFYAWGPNIKKGLRIEAFENIHVYPLMAKILKLKMPPVDGSIEVLEQVYKK